MANKISNSGKRKLAILKRATSTEPGSEECGVLVNRKYCFAFTDEQAMKDLLRGGFMVLRRHGWSRSNWTKAHITAKGRELLKKLEQQKDKFKMT